MLISKGCAELALPLTGRALTGEPRLVDDLIEETGIPVRRVLSALTLLELDGHITQHTGKRYTRAVTLAE